MAEAKKQKRKISIGTWIALLLALILIVELGVVALNVLRSRGARGKITLSQIEDSLLTEGVSFYDLGRDFTVDHDFLVKLMALSQQEINAVRLPIDVSSCVRIENNHASLDGEWLYQTASLAEMIFQSEYKVILSLVIPDELSLTPDNYEELWKQIDEAFGHRPASELWYELIISNTQRSASWDSARINIIESIIAANPERQIVLTLPDPASRTDLLGLDDLCENYGIHLAMLAHPGMDMDILEHVGDTAFQNDVSVILIEPEGAEAGYTRSIADANGFGCLLQGE